MADNELTGKVGLDVTDFKAGIASLNREIRVIESGFRATAAGLGDWAKSADGLEARMKALTGQIDLQQKKVSALRSEYERIAAEKGATSRAAQDLQIKLNKETETLNRMQGELDQTGRALNEMGDESKDAAKGAKDLASAEDKAEKSTGRLKGALDRLKGSLGSVASNFKALGAKVLKGIAIGIAAVGAAAVGAAIGIGRFVTNAAKAADEIVESAEKIGISAEKYQEFGFIGEQIGTDVETIGRAFARTTKAILAADKAGSPMAKTFEELGVSTRDANGNLRDSEEVFGNIIDALGKVENETQREILAQSIFGKSYQELIPLINLGADGLAKMTDEAHKMGAVMGEDTVNALADFNDRLAAMKGGFKGIMGQLAAKLLPVVNKVMDAFQAWLMSPEVQAGIKRIIDKVGEFAKVISGVIDKLLKGDIKGALSGIIPPETASQVLEFAKAFGSFVKDTLIPFIQKHSKEIKGAFIAIGAALAAAGIVAAIASIASGIGPLIAIVGLLGAAWAGNWGGIRDTLTKFWFDTAKPILEQLWAWLKVNIPIAIQALKDFWTNVLLPALQTFWAWVQANIIPLLQQLWEWLKVNIPIAIQALKDLWTGVLLPAMQAFFSWLQANVFPILQTLWDWLATNVPAAISTLSDFWTGTLQPALQVVWDFINTSLVPLFQALWELLSVAGKLAITILQGLWENVLLPALRTVWAFIQDKVIPILSLLWDWVQNKLGPPLQWLANTVLAGLRQAFSDVKDAIQWVIDKIQALIDKLKNLKLPKAFDPGSPTPFELGLRGIAAAMDDLNKKSLPNLQANLNMGGKGGQMVATAPITVNIQATVTKDTDWHFVARKVLEEVQRVRS